MEPGDELAVFDELFERIDRLATRAAGETVHEDDSRSAHEGTRLTPVKMVGEIAVKFMIFSSKTKTLEKSGKLLYSPTITAFRGDSHFDHIKRIDLETTRSNTQTETERYEQLLGKLEVSRELFDKYEQSASD